MGCEWAVSVSIPHGVCVSVGHPAHPALQSASAFSRHPTKVGFLNMCAGYCPKLGKVVEFMTS